MFGWQRAQRPSVPWAERVHIRNNLVLKSPNTSDRKLNCGKSFPSINTKGRCYLNIVFWVVKVSVVSSPSCLDYPFILPAAVVVSKPSLGFFRNSLSTRRSLGLLPVSLPHFNQLPPPPPLQAYQPARVYCKGEIF